MITHPQIQVFESIEHMGVYVLAQWQRESRGAINNQGRFTVALSGGRTPLPLYQYLSAHGSHLPWDKIHIFQVDERFVPIDHPDSNARLIREALLLETALPDENFHFIPRRPDVEMTAEVYQQHMMDFFGLLPGQIPSLDCILLGIGDDGHTASLFPGQEMDQPERLIFPVHYAQVEHARITMSLALINAARIVSFTVVGSAKADIIKKIVLDRDVSLPAAHIAPVDGELYYLLDSAAASDITQKDPKDDKRDKV